MTNRFGSAAVAVLRAVSPTRLGLKAALLGTASLFVAQPGFAQVSADAAAAQPAALDEVVVTGSRIQTNGFQQPTPVTVIGGPEIQRDLPTSVANFLNELPSFGVPSSPSNPGVGVSGGGLSLLNLRNLGTARTLVLLDNRRVVGSTPAGGVDTNTLPTTLIQRIEVVTGGASAAWGADAVAGVVNFVLNHDYEGIGVSAQAGISEQGDDRNFKTDLTFGRKFAGGRGSVVAAVQYSTSPDIPRARDRDWWTNSGVVPNPLYKPGNGQPQRITVSSVGPVEVSSGGIIVSGPLRGTQFVGPLGTPTPYNFGFNAGVVQWGGDVELATAANRDLSNALDYGSAFMHTRYDFTDNITGYLEASYGKSVVKTDSLYYTRNGNLTIRADNAFLPTSVRDQLVARGQTSFTIGKLLNDQPAPGSRNQREVMRLVGGVDGRFGSDWKWGAYYQHGEADILTTTYNNPLIPRFNLAVDAVKDPATGAIVCRSTLTDRTNGCVPYNVIGSGVASAAAIQWVFGTVPFQEVHTKQDVVSANASGTVFTLPAGAVSLAAGAEFTKESAYSTQDEASRLRQYFTGNFQPFVGERTVKEAFAETVVPLLNDLPFAKHVELNAAARLTDYSTSGRVVTWKVGVSYEVTDDLRFRITRSRDIRAPSLTNLFTRGQTGSQNVFDPLTNRVYLVLANTRGNPDLQPEKADTWTGGVVYRPSWVPGLGLSVDYYAIDVKGAIDSLSSQQTVERCFAGQTELCDLIIRDANRGIVQIDLFPSNITSLKASGVDLELSYRRQLGPGALTTRALASYLDKFTQVGTDGVVRQLAGAIGDRSNSIPKLKATFSATYDLDPYSLTARVRLLGSAKLNDEWGPGDVDDNSIPRIGYLDLRATYKVEIAGADSELSFAVDNVFNTDPPTVPVVPGTTPYPIGTVNRPDLYDVIGRSYRVGFRAKF